MASVIFENQGTLPIQAITTMGVSVKEKDDAIGYFGTGLKYAIAVLLREGQRIVIGTDGQWFEFQARKATIRGQDFDVVWMTSLDHENGEAPQEKELGFTTLLGQNWKVWQAYRELYCNAIDEKDGEVFTGSGDEIYRSVTNDAPKGRTLVIVEGKKFMEVHQDREHYLIDKDEKPYQQTILCDAYHGTGSGLYYRGIRIADLRRPAMYRYNLKGHVELTEDRTLKYEFRGAWSVMSLVMASTDVEFIKKVLMAPRDSFEFKFDYLDTSYSPGPAFLEAVGQLREEVGDSKVNPSAVRLHKERVARFILPTESDPMTSVQQKMLERGKTACGVLGCSMDLFPIIYVESLGENILGKAENNTIYLSKLAFDRGTKIVAGTLYEEYIHLKHKLDDYTLEMQNYLVDALMSAAENLTGEPL